MSKKTIAAHIPTYNCPELLLKCVSYLLWVDEIIIADNSTNDSVENIISFINKTNIKYFKSDERDIRLRLLAMNDKTESDYILWVHTDECYSKSAAVEIRKLLDDEENLKDGYLVPSESYLYCEHYGKGADQLRLFRKDNYYFEMKSAHDMPKINGNLGKLVYGYAHFNSETFSSQMDKVFLYASSDAKIMTNALLDTKRTDKLSSFKIKKHYFLFLLKVIWRSKSVFFTKNISFVNLWGSYLLIMMSIANDCNPTEEARKREGKKYD